MFATKGQLEDHKQSHLLKCPQCDKTFRYKNNLHNHVYFHNNPPICDVCQKACKTYEKLKEHKIIHTNEKPYKCDLCPKAFNNQGSRHRHKTNEHNAMKAFCNVCSKVFKNTERLAYHKNVEHDSGKEKLECPTCSQVVDKRNLNAHNLVHSGYKPFKCVVCSKTFNNKGSLYHHKKIHNPDNIPCDTCSKLFKSVIEMRHHKKSHQSERPICDVCKKGVADLKGHIARVHKKETNFSCQHCPRKFYDKKDHDVHMTYKHGSGERKFKCGQCDKKYLGNGELQDHIKRIHITIYDFACNECDSKFKVRRILQRHQQEVHSQSVDIFYCKVCSKELSSKIKLKSHSKSHEEKVKCDKCNAVIHAAKLQSHIKKKHVIEMEPPQTQEIHTCDICEKPMKSISCLRKHSLTHTSRTRDFKCLTCNSEFTTANNLKVHQIIHTSEKPFKCGVEKCLKSFNNNGSFHRHRTSQHI